MIAWRRLLAVAATLITLTLVTGAVISATQTGTGAFSWLASNVPVANVAAAGGGGGQATSVLPPIAISVASPVNLVSKIQLDANVTVTCGPFVSVISSSASVTVSEASGHVISHATGTVPALICDGGPHTFAVTLIASDVPFRPGKGTANSSAFAFGTAPDFSQVSVSGSNTQAVDISK